MLDLIVAKRLRRRLTTVIDSTGLDAKRRAGWRALAERARRPAYAVVFDTPADVVRARNRARADAGPGQGRHGAAHEAAAVADALAGEGFAGVHAAGPGRARAARVPDGARRRRPPGGGPDAARVRAAGLALRLPRPPGHDAATLAAVARAAEDAGFTSLWVMDHFLQIPQVGREWEDMLESHTTLGYLAGVTERIRLGTLVTGISYRNLAHLAKIVATLDVLSGGRALCGLGAAWFEREHRPTAGRSRRSPSATRGSRTRSSCCR